MRRKRALKLITSLTLMLLFVLSGMVYAKGPRTVSNNSFAKASDGPKTRTLVNIGNWSYWIYYDGKSANDPDGNSGGVYPRGKTGTIFQDGLVWGCIVRNATEQPIRVGGATYRVGTRPGPYGVAAGDSRNGVYRIRTDYKTLTIAQVKQDAAEQGVVPIASVSDADAQAVIDQYKYDWENWPVDRGAPWVDKNGNGTWDGPDVDEPGIANADQVAWYVVNDADESATVALYGSQPIGIELQVTLWAYNQPNSSLGQIIFKKYRFINKSGTFLDSMYVSQWADPDMGNYGDDLVGCDTTLSLGFVWNGADTDDDFNSFNLAPASVGYDFFQGPMIYTGNPTDTGIFDLQKQAGYKNLPMTSFVYFAAGSDISDPPLGDYDGTLGWFNMLRGYTPTTDVDNPTPYTAGSGPNAGQATLFPLSGDPVTDPTGTNGDIDGQGSNLAPADRRMVMNSGPFVMAPGDTQEVVVALIGGLGSDRYSSISVLKQTDGVAQKVYDLLFENVPKPPAAPQVVARPFEDHVVLEWGSNWDAVQATEADNVELDYYFEGYNVYQLPNQTASIDEATRVATFDLVNGIRHIRSFVFDPDFGEVVQIPIQFGEDAGIQHSINITKDYLTGEPLYKGKKYYFAVTAYNYNPVLDIDKSLESPLIIVEVTPQTTKPGDVYNNEVGDAIEVTKVGGSTGSAAVKVVDPAKLTGHSYKVGFYAENSYTLDTAGDTLGIYHKWYLVDVTTGDTLLKNMDKFDANGGFPIVDGVEVKITGPTVPGLASWDYSGTRWVSGVNWGGAQFFGGLDVGYNFFGSTLGDADLVPLNIKFFADTTAGPADGWASKGAVYNRSAGYAHEGSGYLPMAAYDVLDAANPRQTNICFVEFGNHNHRWDMGGWDGTAYADPDLGGREYTFFMKSSYDEGVSYDDNNWGPASDVLYAVWPHQRGSHPYLEADFEMNIYANIPHNETDSYTWSTTAAVLGDANVAKQQVEKINVYPNPYYAYNSEQTNRFDKFVTFSHLPEVATIRIFNLAGQQVRKLEKNSTDQFMRWDLKNESGLPVGSGIYFAHVDMPDLGKEKVLKVFIIQSAEFLQYF